MAKLAVLSILLNLALTSCTGLAQKDEASNGNKPPEQANSTAQPKKSPGPINSNGSTQLEDRSSTEMNQKQLLDLMPKELRQLTECNIEEDVTVTPDRGGAVSSAILFDASGSKAPCGKIVRYVWDFGDGTKGKGGKARHAYKSPGRYRVTLNMTDDKGNHNLLEVDYVVTITPDGVTTETVAHPAAKSAKPVRRPGSPKRKRPGS